MHVPWFFSFISIHSSLCHLIKRFLILVFFKWLRISSSPFWKISNPKKKRRNLSNLNNYDFIQYEDVNKFIVQKLSLIIKKKKKTKEKERPWIMKNASYYILWKYLNSSAPYLSIVVCLISSKGFGYVWELAVLFDKHPILWVSFACSVQIITLSFMFLYINNNRSN